MISSSSIKYDHLSIGQTEYMLMYKKSILCALESCLTSISKQCIMTHSQKNKNKENSRCGWVMINVLKVLIVLSILQILQKSIDN